MEFDINLDGHSLTHEGKLPEAQEFLLQGKELLRETPTDHLTTLATLNRIAKLLDTQVIANNLPNLNSSTNVQVYKNLNVYLTPLIQGHALFAGFLANSFGASAQIPILFFDGYDTNSPMIASQNIDVTGRIFNSPLFPTPIKINTALAVGISCIAADALKIFGSYYLVQE